ncbi:hypothetical protein TcCL_NonESM10537 [Trypanosoma cruzi]|nr:hypothetical protein TcCL_NonESM10537 [Trypanosoma cruzi]
MIMNRPLRKATRGRLLFLLRCTSEPTIRGRGCSACRISLNYHEVFTSPSTRTCTQFPCLPSCGRETGMQRGKCGPCQHVVNSFLGGIATVLYVLAGRNGMGEEQRASNNDLVRSNAQ